MHKIEINNLVLQDKNQHILNDVTLTFNTGNIYAVIGKDGTRMSHLFALIDGYQQVTKGTVLVDGEQPYENRSVRENVHFASTVDTRVEARSIHSHFEMLHTYNASFDIEYAKALLKDYGIEEKTMVSSLDYNETPIINAITALASGKPILLLDINHLDMKVEMRQIFYRHVAAHRNNNRIIVIVSSEASEIEHMVDAVIIMDQEKVILDEPVEILLERGYRVTGTINNILAVSRGKKIIHEEHLGEVKSVIMLGRLTADEKAYIQKNRAYYSPIKIQELFEHLTGGKS